MSTYEQQQPETYENISQISGGSQQQKPIKPKAPKINNYALNAAAIIYDCTKALDQPVRKQILNDNYIGSQFQANEVNQYYDNYKEEVIPANKAAVKALYKPAKPPKVQGEKKAAPKKGKGVVNNNPSDQESENNYYQPPPSQPIYQNQPPPQVVFQNQPPPQVVYQNQPPPQVIYQNAPQSYSSNPVGAFVPPPKVGGGRKSKTQI
jgi:hypothetical protein